MALETTRYQTRRRLTGTLALTVGLGAFALLMLGIYPSIAASGVDFEAYVESLPPAVQSSFGVEAFGTVAGFLAAEFYQFVWVLLLGLYMAYAGGGLVATDLERGRLDLVLATPISRSRLLVERFLALCAPVVVLNLVVPLIVYAGTIAIDESLSLARLYVVHALSVPYLLTCGAVGLLLSVTVSRGDLAQRGGIAVVFLLFVVRSVTAGTDVDVFGTLSPTHYYVPSEVLVDGTVDLSGAVVLLVTTLVLFAAARSIFRRRDV